MDELEEFLDAVLGDGKASCLQEATEEEPRRGNARNHCTTEVNP